MGAKMPIEPKTNAELLGRLIVAAQQQMTSDEVRRQRISFVFGNLPKDNTLTKHQVELALARLDGETATKA